MNKTLVILAAGIGSRYGGFKQMDPVGPSGEFIIDYSIYDAIRAGFDKVVFLISKGIADDFKATIGERVGRRVAIDYAFQELNALPAGFSVPADRAKPWGTAHALLSCRNVVDSPFAVINADDYYGKESYSMLAGFLDDAGGGDASYAMVGFVLRNTVSEHGHVARGICQTDDAGLLQTVVERTRIETRESGIRYLGDEEQWCPLTGDEIVSMNLWGFKPSIFPHLERQFTDFLKTSVNELKAEFFIPTVVNNLVTAQAASVKVLETPSAWIGVTYPQDKEPVVAKIRAMVDSGLYPENLWA